MNVGNATLPGWVAATRVFYYYYRQLYKGHLKEAGVVEGDLLLLEALESRLNRMNELSGRKKPFGLVFIVVRIFEYNVANRKRDLMV